MVIQTSVQPGSDFFPRNGCDLAGVDLAYPALDLLGPGQFHVPVRLTDNAVKEPTRKLRPIVFRQLGCLLEKVSYFARHEGIVRLGDGNPRHGSVLRIAISMSQLLSGAL